MKYITHQALVLCAIIAIMPLVASAAATLDGERKLWHTITLGFEGPQTHEGGFPNPFTDYRLNVTITGPGGQQFLIPGFYAADGDAANTSASSGNIWCARFNTDQVGTWTYEASFRKGAKVNIGLEADAGSSAGFFDGETGTFEIAESDKTGKDFRAKGRLEYVGEHYMQFAQTRQWFLKAGTDSPENFWAFDEMDNTPTGPFGIHSYSTHERHWDTGDPTWGDGKGKAIIGVINYLSSQGINSVYALTMNSPEGDGKDVFMWVDPDDLNRFDVSKLEQWNIVIEHANSRGVQLHMVLSERENDEEVFGREMNDERRLYLRELAARFSHNLAIQWNLGEENKNTVSCRKAVLTYLRAQDPYRHPHVVHNEWGKEEPMFSAHLGETNFEGISLQDRERDNVHPKTLEWYSRSEEAGRKWIVQHDESYPNRIQKNSDNTEYRQKTLWGNLMAGGAGVEFIMDGLLQVEDFTQWSQTWKWMRVASEFFMTLPLPTLKPHDDLISPRDDLDHCLADPGSMYLVYIGDGGRPQLRITEGTYTLQWLDPVNGGLQNGSVKVISGSGDRDLGSPPDKGDEWLVYVKRD